MNQTLLILEDEVKEEFAKIQKVVKEIDNILTREKFEVSISKPVLIGALLDNFYRGVEKIFERIVREIDGFLPQDDNWHKKLLRLAALEVPGLRPPVINKVLYNCLEEYLRFRHLQRNIYGHMLEWERIEPLVKKLPKVLSKLDKALKEFFLDLKEIEKEI
jgi:hypothetical protein